MLSVGQHVRTFRKVASPQARGLRKLWGVVVPTEPTAVVHVACDLHHTAHHVMIISCTIFWRQAMRTTIALDDELLAKAQSFTGLKEKSSVVHEALKALIARESGRRLALLGGSDPEASAAPRRRTTAK